MCGFLIGTACLLGLVVTLARGRSGGCGGGWRGRRWGGGGPWAGGSSWDEARGGHGPRNGWRGGERWLLRGLFERLDTTPGQEKVILEAFEELRTVGESMRGEVRRTRGDVAKAARSASFDETLMGELFARHDSEVETLRKAFVGAIAKVHAVLDEKQRERLAELIEGGAPFFGGWGGPYRRHAM